MITAVRVALAPIMRAWAASRDDVAAVLPHPTDSPQVHSAGNDSDRVLFFGSGPAVGWGVSSHDLALPGCLARALTSRTGRGADIDIVADPTMSIRTARAALGDVKLWRYDAIVITLGINDALQVTSERAWRDSVAGLLAFLEAGSSHSARIFVVGVQSIRSIPTYDSLLGGIAEHQARSLNRATELACAETVNASFLRLVTGMRDPSDPLRGSTTYRLWAEELADAMVQPLNEERLEGGSAGELPVAASNAIQLEAERQRAVDSLGILDTEAEDRFDRIVTMARQTYGTQAAMFSLVDNDRVWNKSRDGTNVVELPRGHSFCSVAIRDRGAMIVSDASKDARFVENPFVEGEPRIRFYAGFPVESPSGERIGALCVFDPKPRPLDQVDESMLRQLALLVQEELRRDPATE